MDKTATTMRAEEAIARINALTTKEEIEAFMVDEERKTVISAATDKLASIVARDKQGEQKGLITQDAADFKEGIQKTKDVSNDSRLTSHVSRLYITCEDVIAKMRKEGKKI